MSEPLSRGTLEAEREALRHTVPALGDPPVVARLIRYAHAERDRVAELEKERDERLSVEAADQWLAHRFHEVCDRAEAAEAGLAAAQEALQWIRDYTGPAPVANMRAYAAARLSSLARGGGQQETR